MRRALYRFLLFLHPASFRRRFAGEMMWVFDEAVRDRQAAGFCTDVAGSLLRQWVRQPMLWSIAGALVGPALAMFWMSATRPRHLPARPSLVQVEDLLYLAVGSLLAISLTLTMTVALFHSLSRRKP
jgi:hypothetical protein